MTVGDKMNLTSADGINRATDTAVMIIQGDQVDFVGFDGPFIYTNRDKITRTDVKYVLLEGRKHGDLMMDYSEERLAYMEKLDAEYNDILAQYEDEVPDEVKKAWNDTIDKKLTSQLNEELFADILDFYLEAIGD